MKTVDRLKKKKRDHSLEELNLVTKLELSDDPTALFGAAVEDRRRKNWIKTHNVTRSTVRSPTGAIGGEVELLLPSSRRKEFRESHLCLPMDHVECWKRGGKLICVTSAPYHIYNDEIMGLAALIQQFGLEVKIEQMDAWYYAGFTHLVEIWKSRQIQIHMSL